MIKKTLYHSELAKQGIISCRVNSEPIKSQYPDKPKYVILEIDGEERYYNCENEECELILTGHRDQWVEMEASGSHEDASIRLEVLDKPADAREAIKQAKARIAAVDDGKPRRSEEVRDKGEHGREPVQEEMEPVRTEAENSKLKSYATHAGKIFGLAWEESKNTMALIPEKDATELSAYEWLDLRLRIAQGYTIEINKIIRKERF